MIRTILYSFFLLFTFSLGAQDLCSSDRLVEPIFEEVQVTNNVVFDAGIGPFNNDIDLVMNIYEPAGDELERRPVIVMAHGGSFVTGSRNNPVMVNTCTELARRGYVAASIEYSLFPFLVLGQPDSTDLINVITKAMGEMKSAVRFFREDGLGENQYRVDPNLISVGGYSAGAILACHQGMLDEDDVIDSFVQDAIDTQGGFANLGNRLGVSDEVLSIFSIAGSVYEVDFIDENSTPIYSGHGNADETVPYVFGLTGGVVNSHGSFNIHQEYEAQGIENQLFTFEGGGHSDIFTEAIFENDLLEMYENFFVWNKDQICGLLSSNDELALVETSIFPNPTDGELNFKFGNDLNSDYTIEVYNQIGQQMFSSQKFSNQTAQINLGSMNNGLYLVKINFDENYHAITRRIVIANN